MFKELITQVHDKKEGLPRKVSLIGKLSGTDAILFTSMVTQLMEGVHEDLELDLTTLHSIDLKGMNSLMAAYKVQNRKGCRIQFVHRQGNAIMETIAPTKLHKILPFKYVTTRIAS